MSSLDPTLQARLDTFSAFLEQLRGVQDGDLEVDHGAFLGSSATA